MTFAPGDVVTLKSGGHSMTVVSAGEEDIDCLWVGDDGELFRQSIPAIALMVIELTESEDADAADDEETEEDTAQDAEEDDEEDGEDDEDDDEEEEDDEKSGEAGRSKRR